MNTSRLTIVTAIAPAVILAILAGYLWLALKQARWESRVANDDEAFVVLAYRREGAFSEEAMLQFRKALYPRVIRFPGEVCVQLRARAGWTDGGSIYCFAADTRRPTRSFLVAPYRPLPILFQTFAFADRQQVLHEARGVPDASSSP